MCKWRTCFVHCDWFTRAAVCAWGFRSAHVLIEHALRCRECIVFGRNDAINRLTIETSEERRAGVEACADVDDSLLRCTHLAPRGIRLRPPAHTALRSMRWFDVQNLRVGEGYHARPRKRYCLSVITHLAFTFGFTRYPPPASTKAPMGTILAQLAALPGRWCFRPPAHTALRSMCLLDGRKPPCRGGLPRPPTLTEFVSSPQNYQQLFVGAGLCACPFGVS